MTRILAAIVATLALSFTLAGPAQAGTSSPTCRDPFYCAPPAPCSPTTCPLPRCCASSSAAGSCTEPRVAAQWSSPSFSSFGAITNRQ